MVSAGAPLITPSKVEAKRERESNRYPQPSDSPSSKSAVTKTDVVRERELFRYFQPPEPISPRTNLSVHAASSPDTTLTALAQLCALRLHAKRAMISVIDREKQYFVAESTKTLDLVNNDKSEVEGDGLWIGCSTVDKSGRLCEKTIELPPAVGRYPCFTVTDLSKDDRFKDLPFVTGSPFFRFYVGTPLVSKRGINIGSLFILDDEVRQPLTADQESFLGTIAQTVMKHMEITSEAEERKKVLRLSSGMNSFVQGKNKLVIDEESQDLGDEQTSDTKNDSRWKPTVVRIGNGSRILGEHIHAETNGTQSEPDTSHDESDSERTRRNVDIDHRITFARAACILSECLELRDTGGVVFFDTTSSRFHTLQNGDAANRDKRISQQTADIVSYSTSVEEQGLRDRPSAIKSFRPVTEDFLHSLLSRYPRGKMWAFDEDGSLSSSEEEPLSQKECSKIEGGKQSRSSTKQQEAVILQNRFPGVRQLIFAGLWDAGNSRFFAGGFAWTTSSRQILSQETEFSFFTAFGNSVMAEVSRLASIAADRQKADFIGSISHEFRSPLHGILASAEFLAETKADAFQGSLVDTISSCGRTLLDTINHILDYSKINSFESNWRNAHKPGNAKARTAGVNRRSLDKESPPMMNIYSTVDVAVLTEEVVEGVYAGQIYQDISSTEATDFSTGAKAEASDRGIRFENQTRSKKVGKKVEVIIDIAHENYVFTTQPGALRRIIMNIFGNALKYSQNGSIVVKVALDSQTSSGLEDNERMLEIKVTDTGKGISPQYLRTSLFNPFCQEDVLASGTGLGLSIVKSIVTMLRGSIDVQSELGLGTVVTILVPLSRLAGSDTPHSTPSTIASSDENLQDDSIHVLQSDYQSTIVVLNPCIHEGQSARVNDAGQIALKRTVEDWLGLRTSYTSSNLASNGLIVVDEKEMVGSFAEKISHLPMVVLCSNSTRSSTASLHNDSAIVQYLSKPFGPHKLAKALRLCLDKFKASRLGLTPTIRFSGQKTNDLESETDTLIPDLEHLTLETNKDLKPLDVQTNGVITASESNNAQLAIDGSSSCASASNETKSDVTITERQDFPFPEQQDLEESDKSNQIEDDQLAGRPLNHLIRRDLRRPPLISRMTEPSHKTPFPDSNSLSVTWQGEMVTFKNEPPPKEPTVAPARSQNGGTVTIFTASNLSLHNGEVEEKTPRTAALGDEKRPPRLLLVDDNKINLRLLETYMRKRNYKQIDSAENGQLAVQAAESHEHGYDIIFMDISMPILNGFEATRAIREIEESRSKNDTNDTKHSPALIIALTGLASSRDQSEAFTSGVDFFMTKPVSFKEVGRLLDNWEAHRTVKQHASLEKS